MPMMRKPVKRLALLLLGALWVLSLNACGQKGALYMPDEPPQAPAQTKGS